MLGAVQVSCDSPIVKKMKNVPLLGMVRGVIANPPPHPLLANIESEMVVKYLTS